MPKLKLSSIPDDKPVKMTVELPASVHKSLVEYAAMIEQGSDAKVDPARLVSHMLAQFMATDRAFLKERRSRQMQQ